MVMLNMKTKSGASRMTKRAKDTGTGLVFALAALLPAKAAAQNRVCDYFASRMSIAMDTIRPGMTVKCTSSPDKKITIENGPNANIVNNSYIIGMQHNVVLRRNTIQNIMPNKTVSDKSELFNQAVDRRGRYYTLPQGNLRRVDKGKYEYNTDAMFDKYYALAKFQFPAVMHIPQKFLKISVYCVELFDQVNIYDMRSGGEGRLVGSMVVDFETSKIFHHSTKNEVYVYQRDLAYLYSMCVYDGNEEFIYEISTFDPYENRITPGFKISQIRQNNVLR